LNKRKKERDGKLDGKGDSRVVEYDLNGVGRGGSRE
jgi:hypothetical protein